MLLNTLGFMADEHLRHKMNSDNEAIRRSQTAVEAQWRACCAAVADVAYWSDLDDADHAETIALLREHLHADECALGLGSAAAKGGGVMVAGTCRNRHKRPARTDYSDLTPCSCAGPATVTSHVLRCHHAVR